MFSILMRQSLVVLALTTGTDSVLFAEEKAIELHEKTSISFENFTLFPKNSNSHIRRKRGPRGKRGRTGLQGITGAQGTTGAQGATGPQGAGLNPSYASAYKNPGIETPIPVNQPLFFPIVSLQNNVTIAPSSLKINTAGLYRIYYNVLAMNTSLSLPATYQLSIHINGATINQSTSYIMLPVWAGFLQPAPVGLLSNSVLLQLNVNDTVELVNTGSSQIILYDSLLNGANVSIYIEQVN